MNDDYTSTSGTTEEAKNTGTPSREPSDTSRLSESRQLEAISELLRETSDGEGDPASLPDQVGGAEREGQGGAEEEPAGADGGSNDDSSGAARGEEGADGVQEEAQREADGEGEGEGASGALSVKDLAKRLDTTEAELYNSLQISTGDGEKLTLSDLKDREQERATREREIATRSQALNDREAGLTSDIQSLAILDVGGFIPEATRQQVASHLGQMAQREWQNFTALVPEMKDDARRAEFEADVTETLSEYGLTVAQFGVKPAGLLRLMRDVVRDRKTLKRLTAPKPKPAPQSVKRQRARPAKPADPVNRGSKINTEIGAIADILKG